MMTMLPCTDVSARRPAVTALLVALAATRLACDRFLVRACWPIGVRQLWAHGAHRTHRAFGSPASCRRSTDGSVAAARLGNITPPTSIAATGSQRTASCPSTSLPGLTLRGAQISDMSGMAADMREQMDQDERVRILMEGMRGKSLNDADFAMEGTSMQVVEFDGSGLPLTYDPDVLKEFYAARPLAVASRLAQVGTAGEQVSDRHCVGRAHWQARGERGRAHARAARSAHVARALLHQAGAGARDPPGHPLAAGHVRAAAAVRQGPRVRQRPSHGDPRVRARPPHPRRILRDFPQAHRRRIARAGVPRAAALRRRGRSGEGAATVCARDCVARPLPDARGGRARGEDPGPADRLPRAARRVRAAASTRSSTTCWSARTGCTSRRS